VHIIVLTDELLTECEEVLEYAFQDRAVLRQALTHSSVAQTRGHSNERLEFLGDAILGAIICEELFQRYTDSPEGELTRIKSVIVSRQTCAMVSHQLGLERFLLVGKGISGAGRVPGSIYAAVFEAVVGAMYLDGGRDVVRRFVLRTLSELMSQVAETAVGANFKSQLQQLAQKSFGETPMYQVLDEKGPDHSKCFQVAATIGARQYTAAWGPSKKEAEQQAACNALRELQGATVSSTAE
jgi:ribonuclease-3